MSETPTSGNRWEPDPDQAGGAAADDAADDVAPAGAATPPPTDAAPPAGPPPPPPSVAPVDRRSRAIAAGIAALVLVGSVGVGGFALGRTTADHRDGDHPRFPQGFSDGDRPQPPAGFPGGDGDFDGDGDGPGLPYGDDDGGAGTDESGTTSSS